MTVWHKNLGDSFNDYLEDQGLLEGATKTAIKRVLAWQIEKEMKEKKISKTEMAKKMDTSRSSLNRLLDPAYESVYIR